MNLAIYKPAVIERSEWALPVDSKSFGILDALVARGSPAASDWTPFEVQLVRKQGGKSFKESDCPWLTSDFLVLRPAAADLLSTFLNGDAELLSLRCEDADLKLLHVWRSLDALDLSRSKLVRFPPGSGPIMKVESHVFHADVIDGHRLFRLSAMPRASIYVHGSVVEAVQKADLRNVSFRLLSDTAEQEVRLPKPRLSVSIADLASTSDEDLWSLLYLALVPRVTGSPDAEYATVKSWTKGLQMLWATQLVDDEVNNGGFNQYFFNSSGQFAMEAIEGLELIGAHERAHIVRKAVHQLFRDAPRLREFYEPRTLEAFMESYKHTDLGAIDDDWLKAPEFFTARTRYIRDHLEDFVIPPL
jgi:hypothetical protein